MVRLTVTQAMRKAVSLDDIPYDEIVELERTLDEYMTEKDAAGEKYSCLCFKVWLDCVLWLEEHKPISVIQ